jgi:hypothetical protein
MLVISKQQLYSRLDTIPRTLKEQYFSLANGEIVWGIGETQHLSDEKIGVIATIVGDVVLGFLHPDDVAREIQRDLGLDKKIAHAIAKEANAKIFAKYKNDILRNYRPVETEEQKPVVSQKIAVAGEESKEEKVAMKEEKGVEGVPVGGEVGVAGLKVKGVSPAPRAPDGKVEGLRVEGLKVKGVSPAAHGAGGIVAELRVKEGQEELIKRRDIRGRIAVEVLDDSSGDEAPKDVKVKKEDPARSDEKKKALTEEEISMKRFEKRTEQNIARKVGVKVEEEMQSRDSLEIARGEKPLMLHEDDDTTPSKQGSRKKTFSVPFGFFKKSGERGDDEDMKKTPLKARVEGPLEDKPKEDGGDTSPPPASPLPPEEKGGSGETRGSGILGKILRKKEDPKRVVHYGGARTPVIPFRDAGKELFESESDASKQ